MLPSDAGGCFEGEPVAHPTHVDLSSAHHHFSFAIRSCSAALISVICSYIRQRASAAGIVL